MGAFTLSVCAIDAMAYLRSALPYRKDGIRANFKHWVERWLVPLDGECVPDVLWAVRCGLVHVYGFSHAMATCGMTDIRYAHNDSTIHWKQLAPGCYGLSLDRHLAEITVAAFRFFDGLAALCQAEPTFQGQLKGRLSLLNLVTRTTVTQRDGQEPDIKTEIEAPPTYADMDPALASLDEDVSPDVATIETEIHRIYSER